jgi:RsiW-degrading membrane proteinase PrsW (M82 family)
MFKANMGYIVRLASENKKMNNSAWWIMEIYANMLHYFYYSNPNSILDWLYRMYHHPYVVFFSYLNICYKRQCIKEKKSANIVDMVW